MNTVTIDSNIYIKGAEMYAKLYNISVESVFEKGINLLLEKFRAKRDITKTMGASVEYYISPKVKALETGFECPADLSSDYKAELSEGKDVEFISSEKVCKRLL